jgi:hypothetical protein
MFLLDSLMIAGLRWTLQTIQRAADADMNDDRALREQLLEAEMRREMGDITDEEFTATERALLDRIRDIRERRGEGAAALAFGGTREGDDGAGARVQVEASIGGDFHETEPADAGGGGDAGAAAGRPAASRTRPAARRAPASKTRRRS